MGHTFTNHLYHIIFSTKERRNLIINEFKEEIFHYMCGIARNRNCQILKINGMPDHIHMLALISPSISISDFVHAIKGTTSKWIKSKFPKMHLFEWQAGYSSFSVSESQRIAVVRYIEQQEEHHKTRTFAEELEMWLKKNRISYESQHFLD